MNKLTITTLMTAACLSTNVMAKNNAHYDYARVVEATPVYEQIERRIPIEECRYNGHRKPNPTKHNSALPTVAGAIIGGTVGHTIGKNKNNKQFGLVAGSVIGAVIGSEVSSNQQHHHKAPGKSCTTSYQVEYEQVLTGYNVTYKYRGHNYYTYTEQHPGQRLRVKVNVEPAKGRHNRRHG